MSNVRIEERKPTKAEFLLQARKLVKYSLIILASNKSFKSRPTGNEEDDRLNPPQPELVGKLRETVIDIYISAYSANDVRFTKDNYRHRRQLQDKSISKCNEMLALVEMSVPIFHIPYKRFGHWTGGIVYTRNLIQKWKESDYSRYRRM